MFRKCCAQLKLPAGVNKRCDVSQPEKSHTLIVINQGFKPYTPSNVLLLPLLNDKIASFTISLCMTLIFWPPLLLTGALEVIGGDPTVMQLIHTTASWPVEVEVKGAPQIKCYTRRSVGPSCGTQIRPEEKSESDTFLRHETQLQKLLHLQGLHFVLFCSSAPFDVLSLAWSFFFYFNDASSLLLIPKIEASLSLFCGLSCFWLSLSRVLCLTQAFPHPR